MRRITRNNKRQLGRAIDWAWILAGVILGQLGAYAVADCKQFCWSGYEAVYYASSGGTWKCKIPSEGTFCYADNWNNIGDSVGTCVTTIKNGVTYKICDGTSCTDGCPMSPGTSMASPAANVNGCGDNLNIDQMKCTYGT